MELVNKIKLIACGFVLFLLPNYAIADYIGPSVVVEGGWGEEDIDFGLKHQDMGDDFPKVIKVNIKDNIFILDRRNHRVKIHNNNGELISIVKPKNVKIKFIWPGIMDCDSENNIYTSKYDNKLQKYNIDGKLLWEKNVSVGSIDVQNDGSVIIVGYRQKKGEKKWIRFSPTGQLLETYKERPLELGVVKGRSLGGKRYRTTIKYTDMTYTLNKGPYRKYIRICKENIYAVSGKSAEIFNTSGEAIDKIIMPKDQINEISPGGRGMEAVSEVIEQYGDPVIAPNGDVYTWKRTKGSYSIIKWIWIESRTAPVNLKASASDGKISLSWKTPKQDANSVKAYEIYRSSDVCGPFNKIDKVKKDILQYTDKKVKKGETYYYQVCAERGSGYSGYSNKAVGSIKN